MNYVTLLSESSSNEKSINLKVASDRTSSCPLQYHHKSYSGSESKIFGTSHTLDRTKSWYLQATHHKKKTIVFHPLYQVLFWPSFSDRLPYPRESIAVAILNASFPPPAHICSCPRLPLICSWFCSQRKSEWPGINSNASSEWTLLICETWKNNVECSYINKRTVQLIFSYTTSCFVAYPIGQCIV